ncbi:LysM peptidoglycan-binding domain-containing protein [Phenylobacterium sp.]|uniref:LysM peptidoglycan-binding domain-containing protein n=1 Tax=Phenylobacterium sp. TaxID=1871053 RepID=UPI0025E8DB7E|nr:LysM peptidoglycan-binding domain-containing protein [Phenylobacterium sp.]
MNKRLERTVLVLLAGTALSVGATPGFAVARPAVQPPPTAAHALGSAVTDTETVPVLTFAPPAVDAAAHVKSRRHHRGAAAAEAAKPTTYKVRKGDTLAIVAGKLGTDIETLAKANHLRKPYPLTPGQVLKGPKGAEPAADQPSKRGARSSAAAEPKTYVVKSGDTLFSIAKRFGVTVAALKAENGIGRSASIARGRKLRLPGDHETRAEPARDETPAPSAKGRRHAEALPVREAQSGPTEGASGRVVEVAAPGKGYRIRKGDTLEKVARKLDTGIEDLARLNRLKRPYHLRPGQTIHAAGSSAKAYVVVRGDTLAGIAQRFGVSVDKLRAANGLRRGGTAAPGRKLRLPAGYRDRGPVLSPTRPERDETPPSSFRNPPPVGQTLPPPRSAAPSEGLPGAPQPYNPSGRTPRPSQSYNPQGGLNGAPTASPPVSDAQIMQMGRGLFAWPLRGEILSGFGGRGSGPRNDGLNIRANAGDPVRAAASGEVIYSGDQVPGFGNLVLISHADGWVTAYSNLGKVGVRMRQKVTQGEQIGEAGSSGGVSEPQLHFEVRYRPSPDEKYRAVDPALVMPK